MVLKLPYINGRQIQQWYSDRGIKIEKKVSQQVAIKARQAEKRVLGNKISKPKPQ